LTAVVAAGPDRDPAGAGDTEAGTGQAAGQGAGTEAHARGCGGPQAHARADRAVPGGAERPRGGGGRGRADGRVPGQAAVAHVRAGQDGRGRGHADPRGRRE